MGALPTTPTLGVGGPIVTELLDEVLLIEFAEGLLTARSSANAEGCTDSFPALDIFFGEIGLLAIWNLICVFIDWTGLKNESIQNQLHIGLHWIIDGLFPFSAGHTANRFFYYICDIPSV